MAKKSGNSNSIGSLSFLFGVVIAVLVGVISPGAANTTLISLLILLGIIVGILNITRKETNAFLMATVSLVIVSALGGAVLGQVALVGNYLEAVLMSILTFVIPATIIVSIKSIYTLAER
jgi:hypothetical protein